MITLFIQNCYTRWMNSIERTGAAVVVTANKDCNYTDDYYGDRQCRSSTNGS